MVSQGEAFCPGHVTAFFEVVEDAVPRKMGSRGAGLCLSLGVTTLVRLRADPRPSLEIRVNDHAVKAEVTERAARKLLGRQGYEVKIFSDTPLPMSQGFGVSGAAALSTLLALDEALGRGTKREELVALAHETEVECGTGLGDVVPASLGGMDLRREPGAPDVGRVDRFDVQKDLLLAVVGPELPTRAVLRDPVRVGAINRAGAPCVAAFARSPTFERLFDLGNRFMEETGLASRAVRELVQASRMFGRASMAMLGNAVFAEGGREELASLYLKFGTLVRCQVDNEGARVL